jgi:D-alanyl-D-alanine carboxypeptidase (penicillin-binding protein 5/6)
VNWTRVLVVAGTSLVAGTLALAGPAQADSSRPLAPMAPTTPATRAASGSTTPTPAPCPSGQTPTTLPATAPPTPPTPGTASATIRHSCALVPIQAPDRPPLAPEHVVGGTKLATAGVVTDLPAGVPLPPWSPAMSYVVADLATGEIIAAKNPHALARPASTLKTLTALVALPKLDPRQVVIATDDDVAADGSRVGLVAGNPYTVEDLFNGLFLVSGNDAAYAIARAYGGRAQLLSDMNTTAAHLGAWDTVAKDPSGLDVDGQFSSAYDLALIGRAGMQLESFRLHAAMVKSTFPGAKDSTGKVLPAFAVENNNPIIDKYRGVIGIKSGFTQAARNTFIGAVKRGDRSLIITSVGSVERQTDSIMALLDWGFAHADQARAVGWLVAPGTAPPPAEWTTVGPGATLSGSDATTAEPSTGSRTGPSPAEPTVLPATSADSQTDATALRWLNTTGGWVSGIAAALGAAGVLGGWLARRSRRRSRSGTYQR